MQSTPSSSSPTTASLFKHGQYAIELNGSVLKAELKGIATPKMLQQYHEDVLSLVCGLKGTQWGFMGSIFGTGILTPEAENDLVDSLKARMSLGMHACVVIADGADVPAMVIRQFERVYEQVGIKYLFCSSEREGLNWLHTMGCEAS